MSALLRRNARPALWHFAYPVGDGHISCTLNYEPGEEGTGPSYDSGGHPGCPAVVELWKAEAGGINITELLSESVISDIEDKALEQNT